jgi:predicted AAA+ superfamily ATPase
LVLDSIKKPSKIETLLKALAFQVGNEVTYHELSQIVQLDKETVEKYIYLLEQAFIIFRLTSFARNLRNELKRSRKIYFYDNGIRNMLISNLTPLQNRQDTGALWENFLVSERIKYTHYHRIYANHYFWRTHAQQEIDYIEERDGKLYAFEFKWNPVKKTRFPKSFLEAYPDSVTQILTKDNFMQFIVSEQTSFPISRIDP